jgi:hypothetical protein
MTWYKSCKFVVILRKLNSSMMNSYKPECFDKAVKGAGDRSGRAGDFYNWPVSALFPAAPSLLSQFKRPFNSFQTHNNSGRVNSLTVRWFYFPTCYTCSGQGLAPVFSHPSLFSQIKKLFNRACRWAESGSGFQAIFAGRAGFSPQSLFFGGNNNAFD